MNQWKKVAWFDKSFSPEQGGWQGTYVLLYWGSDDTDVLQERQYEGLGNVMLGNIGPLTHMEGILLLTTYFYITKDQVTLFMTSVLCDSCGIIQQDNIARHIAQVVQECL